MPQAPVPDVVESMEDSLKGGWVESEQHKYRFLTRDEQDERPQETSVQLSDLSPDQRAVFDDLVKWFNGARARDEDEKLITMGGYAGTGKSTLVSVFAKLTRAKVAYCAFTGKAANVLKQKLRRQGAWYSYVGTIHGLIYKPEKDHKDNHTGFKKVEFLDYELIVVDESSMLSEEIVNDLRSFGIPIIAVGDHGQLPPIEGRFNLMENPQLRLEKVHRLAEGNPIIQLSAYIREYGVLPESVNNEFISYVRPKDMRDRLSALYAGVKTGYDLSNIAVLCYSNSKRRMANNLARELRWGISEEEPPREGDMVMCLRNAMNVNLYNGMRARVLDVKDAGKLWYYNHVVFDEENLEVKAMMFKPQFNRNGTVNCYEDIQQYGFFEQGWMKQLGLLFDFGYALTVHKSQGSAFQDVFLLYERPSEVSADDFRRWLYTAATRSSKRLAIVTR
jgi:exodeoxyribonuclease-5